MYISDSVLALESLIKMSQNNQAWSSLTYVSLLNLCKKQGFFIYITQNISTFMFTRKGFQEPTMKMEPSLTNTHSFCNYSSHVTSERGQCTN